MYNIQNTNGTHRVTFAMCQSHKIQPTKNQKENLPKYVEISQPRNQ